MKKYLQLIIVFSMVILCGSFSFSQSIQVNSGPDSGKVEGNKLDEQLVADLTLKNTSTKKVSFKMRAELITLIQGHEISICWGVCLPKFHSTTYSSPLTYTLEPNAVTDKGLFSVHLYPYMLLTEDPPTYTDPAIGTTIVKIIFENVDDSNDKYEYTITYNVIDPTSVVEVSNISTLEIMDISPNPAFGETQLKFSNSIKETSHIDIYDLQGNLVMRQDVLENVDNISINTNKLSVGTYYCQLISGDFNKSKAKTLIIKR